MKIVQTTILLACLLFGADAGAQFGDRHRSTFGQIVPPFLQEQPVGRTYIVGDTAVSLPNFELPGRAFGLALPIREDVDFGLPNRLTVLDGLRGPKFDFARAQPHLAFFCRLEINEAINNVIPMRFRLGGHSYWQDNLLRR